jgi:nucleoside-diphosphate-sugar epimerase
MSKVVILGDGVLGTELESITGWPVESRKKTSLDIDNIEKLSNIIYKNDIIVNCIAFTDSYGGTKDEHWKINYVFPSTLSNLCLIEDKKLVHISTEFVYANNEEPPTEEDIPLPDNSWYAYSKLLADEYISFTNANALICRLLHKPNPFPYPDVWNVKTSGDLVDKIAILVKELIEKDAAGIFNVGTGDKNLSDLAPNSKVIEPPSHVPKDTRMNLNKLRAV